MSTPSGPREHAELVFGKSLQRIADRPHDARLQVPPSTDVVDQFVRERVVEHPVDGEVAAKRIFPSGAERYGVRSPAIAVRGVTTKRGHFNLPFLLASQDGDHAKRRADNQRPPLAETAPDVVGRGVGRDVVVVRDEPRSAHRARTLRPTMPQNQRRGASARSTQRNVLRDRVGHCRSWATARNSRPRVGRCARPPRSS